MNGREYSPSSWARRYRCQRAGGQSYSHASTRCGRFIHSEIITASASGSTRRMPVRLGEDGRRWCTHPADGVGNIREFARQDRGGRLVNIGHLSAEPTAIS